MARPKISPSHLALVDAAWALQALIGSATFQQRHLRTLLCVGRAPKLEMKLDEARDEIARLVSKKDPAKARALIDRVAEMLSRRNPLEPDHGAPQAFGRLMIELQEAGFLTRHKTPGSKRGSWRMDPTASLRLVLANSRPSPRTEPTYILSVQNENFPRLSAPLITVFGFVPHPDSGKPEEAEALLAVTSAALFQAGVSLAALQGRQQNFAITMVVSPTEDTSPLGKAKSKERHGSTAKQPSRGERLGGAPSC